MNSAPSPISRPDRQDGRAGFTLVEMLVVLAIISILAILSFPAMKGVLGSMDLRGGTNMVTAQFELARQTASTRNLAAELRIYQDPNTTDPSAATGNTAYRIVAVVIPKTVSGAATDEYVSPGLALPGDVVFDQSSTYKYSTLLNPSTATGDSNGNTRQVLSTDSSQDTGAPIQIRNRTYMKITYLPNGTVNLPITSTTSGTWCLSLRNVHAAAVTGTHAAPATDYITLVLDPATSRARVYQP